MALDFSLTDQQADLQRRARERFAAVRDRHRALRASRRQAVALDDVWSTLADLGFHGFLVPERYQGTGTGLVGAVLVMEELAAQGLHSFRPILLSMGAAAIAACGAEALKEEVLPSICRGALRLAIASTEEQAGFNVLNARTFAEKHGDHYIVNGSKIYISGLDITDAMLLVTRTTQREVCERQGLPKTAGLTLLLVDVASEGLSWQPVPSRGEGVMTQFALTLKDVRVPTGRLIGEEGGGAAVMFRMFNPERTLASAMALGMSRYCLEVACAHARRRKVFGDTPIGQYQSVQHPLAEIAIRLEAVRLVVRRAAWLFDQGAEGRAQAASANSAKYLAAELAIGAVDAAIDTFGGKGFDEEHGIIHLWEAARLLKTGPISNALILNQTAERVLGLPRSY
jgi:alkylation response protein AidB-like acyl-CoA dehydrogenase